jgi:hypothetical protein
MTDRELLEAAAKAAGIELDWDVPPQSPPWRMTGEGDDRGPAAQWNPLTDDGDALLLAVKLRLCVKVYTEAVIVGTDHRVNGREMLHEVVKGNDDYPAATRRAIVRAAAAIGGAVEAQTTKSEVK